MESFIALAHAIEINKIIIDLTIIIRKKHRTKLPDAIIAATAVVNNLTLITHNIKDFEKIEDLKILDL